MTAPYLPPEILDRIFDHIPIGYHGQLNHYSICLVSRSWYASAIKRLYHSPSMIGKNFDVLARTLCPSVNANIRKTELARFVHRLDMSKLVYNGSKSLTARVLGRVKGQLEVFTAPAATFSLLAFSALAKCHRLRTLDLEYVIEKIDAVQLLRTVGKLTQLKILYLRMAWVAPIDLPKLKDDLGFPPSLRQLAISGNCETAAARLLYKALGRSKVDDLAVLIGGEAQSELSQAIQRITLKKLRLDVANRPTSPDWETILASAIPELLYHCRQLEWLSIPLTFLNSGFFTDGDLSSEPPYAIRSLAIHPSSVGFAEIFLESYQLDQLNLSISSGHLQHLEEITVLDRTDVSKFLELEQEVPGWLDKLTEALQHEAHGRGGLLLVG